METLNKLDETKASKRAPGGTIMSRERTKLGVKSKGGRHASQKFLYSRSGRKMEVPLNIKRAASRKIDEQKVQECAKEMISVLYTLSKNRMRKNEDVERASFTSGPFKGKVVGQSKKHRDLKEDSSVIGSDVGGDAETILSMRNQGKTTKPEENDSQLFVNVPFDLAIYPESVEYINERLTFWQKVPAGGSSIDSVILGYTQGLLCVAQFPHHLSQLNDCLQSVMSILQRFHNFPRLAWTCCSILEKQIGEENKNKRDIKQALANLYGNTVIDKIMDAYSELPSIQTSGCRLLWGLSEGDDGAPKPVSESVLNRVISAMERFPTDPGLQFEACALLQRLAVDNNNEALIGNHNGIDHVLKAAVSEVLDKDVVKKACAALWNLSFNDQNRQAMIAKKAHTSIFRVIEKFSTQESYRPDIVAKACGVVWNLADLTRGKETLIEDKVPEYIVKTMKDFRFDAKVQEMGCGCLRSLAFNDTSRVGLMNIGAAQKILESMRDHVTNQGIQYQAFAVLKKLSCNDVNEGNLIKMQAGERILEAMDAHLMSASIQERACGVLWNLAVNDDHKVRLVRIGCAEKMLKAMETHKTIEAVQFQTCRTLKRLARDSHNEIHLMRLGAAKHVLDAMKNHMSSANIQEKGCGVLWNLSERDEHKRQLMDLGAAKQILESMDKHIESQNVQYEACGALKRLAVDDQIEIALMRMNAASYVIRAMKKHTTEADVQGQACGVLWNLAFNGQEELMKLEAATQILEAMKNHKENESVQEKACGTLWKLAEVEHNNEKLIKLGVIEKVLDAMDNIPKHEGVQYQACGTLWNLAVKDMNRRPLLNTKAEDRVLRAMRNHRTRADILHSACGVLYNLAQTSIDVAPPKKKKSNRDNTTTVSNRLLLAAKGSVENIFHCIRAHRNNADVVYQAVAAINFISQDPKTLRFFVSSEPILAEVLLVAEKYLQDMGIQENAISLFATVMATVSKINSARSGFAEITLEDDLLKRSLVYVLRIARAQSMTTFFQQKSVIFFSNLYEILKKKELKIEAELANREANYKRSALRRIDSDMKSFYSASSSMVFSRSSFEENLKGATKDQDLLNTVMVLDEQLLMRMVDRLANIISNPRVSEKPLYGALKLLRRIITDYANHPEITLFSAAKTIAIDTLSTIPDLTAIEIAVSDVIKQEKLGLLRMLSQFSTDAQIKTIFPSTTVQTLCRAIKLFVKDPKTCCTAIATLRILLSRKTFKTDNVAAQRVLIAVFLDVIKESLHFISVGDENVLLAATQFLNFADFDREDGLYKLAANGGLPVVDDILKFGEASVARFDLVLPALTLLLNICDYTKPKATFGKSKELVSIYGHVLEVLKTSLSKGYGYIDSQISRQKSHSNGGGIGRVRSIRSRLNTKFMRTKGRKEVEQSSTRPRRKSVSLEDVNNAIELSIQVIVQILKLNRKVCDSESALDVLKFVSTLNDDELSRLGKKALKEISTLSL